MELTKKYLLYLIRWQLSTPILAIVLSVLSKMNPWIATVIANFIGGLMFFWIDRFIFKKTSKVPLWEIKENYYCDDCHKKARCYRIAEWGKYNRLEDKNPEYRCQKCSIKKMNKISH